jgi:integrase
VKNGLSLAGAQATMSAYMEHWLETAKSNLRPNTYAQYGQIIRGHILPALGKVRLKDLRPDMIQTLYNQKLADGASGRTVQMIHAVLHHALDQAVKWGLLGRNPADAVVRPKARRAEMKVLDDGQVRTLLLAARGSRYEVLFQVAVTTGLREGELLGLKWSDLDWKTRRLQIQRQVQRQKGKGIVFTEPKSAAGRRSVVLGTGNTGKAARAPAGPADRAPGGRGALAGVRPDLPLGGGHTAGPPQRAQGVQGMPATGRVAGSEVPRPATYCRDA